MTYDRTSASSFCSHRSHLGVYSWNRTFLLWLAHNRESIEGAPDLVIEILSPTTSRTDRVTKAQIYARHSAPAYWIVDPEREAIEIYLLEADGYRLAAILQGTKLTMAPPFADLRLPQKTYLSKRRYHSLRSFLDL